MTRDHMAAAAVVAALAAAGMALLAAPAAAHTPATFEFTNGGSENTTIVSRQDGTGETAHQLFNIPSVGTITCTAPAYEGTSAKISTRV
jgi:hypothetical protein